MSEGSKYFEDFNAAEKEKYKAKLMLGCETENSSLLLNSSLPYNIKSSRWNDDPNYWPDIGYPDIVNYLMGSKCNFPYEDVKQYKSSAAYQFFKSGKVKTVKSYKPGNGKGVIFLRADVLPLFQSLNQALYKPWILAKKNGVILSTHCTCIAGLGEACCHVIAVLYKVEEIKRRVYECTSTGEIYNCWNCEQVEPCLVRDMDFSSGKRNRRAKSETKNLEGNTIAEPSPEEIRQFLLNVKKFAPDAVIFTAYDPEKDDLPNARN